VTAAIFEGVSPADGAKARFPAVAKAIALRYDAPSWRGNCAICLDALPQDHEALHLYKRAAAKGHAGAEAAVDKLLALLAATSAA
jgi:hypothetical protein